MNALLMALVLTVTLGMTAHEAAAHAVHAQSPLGVHPQVVAFEYATGDIPTYVQVEVYGPGDKDVEFQNGRTDALGRFTFTPNRPGVWAVVMSDGMGHQLRHEVIVAESLFTNAGNDATHASASTSSPSGAIAPMATVGKTGPSTAWKALVGVSVLCNIFLGIALWRRRSAPPSPS